MSVAIYIGDEVSAGGYQLAGLRVHSPQAGQYRKAINRARDEAELVLVSAEIASHIPDEIMEGYLAAEHPAMVVVPDLRSRTLMMDLATRLRRQLGVLE